MSNINDDFDISMPFQDGVFSINEMPNSEAAKGIVRCPTVSALRAIEQCEPYQLFLVIEHTMDRTVGGGFFKFDPNDKKTPDDNGWTIVSSGGHRYKRLVNNNFEVNLGDFGLAPGDMIDVPLMNAFDTARLTGITKVVIPVNNSENSYILNGGVVIDTPISGFVLSGGGRTLNGVNISHVGDNTGITFVRGNGSNLFSRSRIEHVKVVGNSGRNANFVEFQDSWRSGAETCWGAGYTFGSLFVLHNRLQWTENSYFKDIISRSNKYGIYLKRTSYSGGASSFYGLDVEIAHQFAVANSSAIAMPSIPNASNNCVIYSAKIDVMGWFEAGGGHNAVLIGDYNQIIDSDVAIRVDGFGGLVNGTDMRAINVSGLNSICDIYLRQNSQQGRYTDVSSLATGSSLGGFGQAISVVNSHTTINGRNIARARGARYKWQVSTSEDKSFTIVNLPCFSSFRATLSTRGESAESSKIYFINTHGINNLSEVTAVNAYVSIYGNNFRLLPLNGGVGGSSSEGNGGKISWLHLAGLARGAVDATLEIEML